MAIDQDRAKRREIFNDPVTYTEKLLRIRDKRGRIVRFRLNEVQKKILAAKRRAIEAGKPARFVILKARRQGVTTLEQALNFWTVATKKNQQVLTFAHNDDATEKTFRIADLFYQQLAELKKKGFNFCPARLTAHNKRELNFPLMNSLMYVGTAGSAGLGRGDTLQRVHWSEVAWSKGGIDTQRNLLAGITEACSEGEVVLESTANGVGDLFHELCTEALAGQGEWTLIFSPWWDDPTYTKRLTPEQKREVLGGLSDEEKALAEKHNLGAGQIAWRRSKKEAKKGLFLQEYPEDPTTCFLVSGHSLFDKLVIAELLKPMPLPSGQPLEQQIFEAPKAGVPYVAGCDVAEGVPDGDFSVCSILNARTEEQVAVLRGRWKPEDFAKRSAELGVKFNTALISVERNNHGHSCLNTLKNTLHYPRLYHHQEYDEKSKTSVPVLGYPTNSMTRPIMLDDLRAELESRRMVVRDRVLLAECLTFEDNGRGKYEARQGCHDDTIMANAIALQARKAAGATAAVTEKASAAAPPRVFPPSSGSGRVFK